MGKVQELIYWGKLWAMVHDITDADGNVNYGAAARFAAGDVFGLATTGDDEADAAIDNARVLNNIRLAKDEGDKGWQELTDGDLNRIKYDVLPHYDEAVRLRPNDWAYLNERGIAHLENQFDDKGPEKGKADFAKASELAKKSGKPAEYLRMLKQREQALTTFVTKRRAVSLYIYGDTYREQIRLYNELYQLTGNKDYVPLRQQAESYLLTPHAER